MTDASLLHKAAKGKRKAQFELYKWLHADWFPVTQRYFRNEDEQVSAMNHAYLKLLNNLEGFLNENPSDKFPFWAKRILINTCLDQIRSNKTKNEKQRNTDWQEEEFLHSGSDQNLADAAFEAEELQQMIHSLDENKRTVFNLFAIEGFSHKEIASQLGITEDNSRYHLSTARKELKQMVLRAMKTMKSFLL